MQPTIPHHGDEIKVASGVDWLALYQTENGFEIRKVTLEISMVHDAVVDSQPDHRTGKLIAVKPESKQKNILLINLSFG